MIENIFGLLKVALNSVSYSAKNEEEKKLAVVIIIITIIGPFLRFSRSYPKNETNLC